MGKFIALITIVALIAFAVLGSDWLKKVDEGKKTGPRVESLKVCRFVSYNAPCQESLQEISQDNDDIFATVEAKNITNSNVKIVWEYVQGGTQSTIAQMTKDIVNDDVIQIKLEKDLAIGWNLGKYRVSVTLDNSNPITKEFSIVSE